MAIDRESLNDPSRIGVDQSRYPDRQAPRGTGPTDIKAGVFREGDVARKNGAPGKPTPYGERPAPPPGSYDNVKWGGTRG